MNGIAFAMATVWAIALTGFTSDPYALGACWIIVYVLTYANEDELKRIHRKEHRS